MTMEFHSTEELFMRLPTKDIRVALRETRRDAVAKEDELRSLVGTRYHNLLDSVDDAASMHATVQRLHRLLSRLEALSGQADTDTARLSTAAVLHADADDGGSVTPSRRRASVARSVPVARAVAAVRVFLQDIVEDVWSHSDAGRLYAAATTLFAAQLVRQGLATVAGDTTAAGKGADWSPAEAVRACRDTEANLSHFPRHLTRCAHAVVRACGQHGTQPGLASAVATLLLLRCRPTPDAPEVAATADAVAVLLQHRRAAVGAALSGVTDAHDVASRLVTVAELVTQSVADCHALVVPAQCDVDVAGDADADADPDAAAAGDASSATVPQLLAGTPAAVATVVNQRCQGAAGAAFLPATPGQWETALADLPLYAGRSAAAEATAEADVQAALDTWLQDVAADAASLVPPVLALVSSPQELVGVRGVVTAACDARVWSTVFQPHVAALASSLLHAAFQRVPTSVQALVTHHVDQLLAGGDGSGAGSMPTAGAGRGGAGTAGGGTAGSGHRPGASGGGGSGGGAGVASPAVDDAGSRAAAVADALSTAVSTTVSHVRQLLSDAADDSVVASLTTACVTAMSDAVAVVVDATQAVSRQLVLEPSAEQSAVLACGASASACLFLGRTCTALVPAVRLPTTAAGDVPPTAADSDAVEALHGTLQSTASGAGACWARWVAAALYATVAHGLQAGDWHLPQAQWLQHHVVATVSVSVMTNGVSLDDAVDDDDEDTAVVGGSGGGDADMTTDRFPVPCAPSSVAMTALTTLSSLVTDAGLAPAHAVAAGAEYRHTVRDMGLQQGFHGVVAAYHTFVSSAAPLSPSSASASSGRMSDVARTQLLFDLAVLKRGVHQPDAGTGVERCFAAVCGGQPPPPLPPHDVDDVWAAIEAPLDVVDWQMAQEYFDALVADAVSSSALLFTAVAVPRCTVGVPTGTSAADDLAGEVQRATSLLPMLPPVPRFSMLPVPTRALDRRPSASAFASLLAGKGGGDGAAGAGAGSSSGAGSGSGAGKSSFLGQNTDALRSKALSLMGQVGGSTASWLSTASSFLRKGDGNADHGAIMDM